jgi:acyl-CoA thioester hydrolase
MLQNKTKFRVRYGETDQMGVVHHATYLLYFEMGRTELLRDLGTTYREMEEGGIMLPVVSVAINFLGPARYDDELTVVTTLKEQPGVRIRFDYEILNQDKIICHGHSVLAFTARETLKPIRPPQWFAQLVERNL